MLQSTSAQVFETSWTEEEIDLGANVPNLPLSPDNNLAIQDDRNSTDRVASITTRNDILRSTIDVAPQHSHNRSAPSPINVSGQNPTPNSINIIRSGGSGARRVTLPEGASESQITASLIDIRQHMNAILSRAPKTGTVVMSARTQSLQSGSDASALSNLESTQNVTATAQTTGSTTTNEMTSSSSVHQSDAVIDVPALSLHDQGLVAQARHKKNSTEKQPTNGAAMGSRGKKIKSKGDENSSLHQHPQSQEGGRTRSRHVGSDYDSDNSTNSDKSDYESSEAESSDESASDQQNNEIAVKPKVSSRIAANKNKNNKSNQSKQSTQKKSSRAKPQPSRSTKKTTSHAGTPEKKRTNAQRKK